MTLLFPKPVTIRDPEYLAIIRTLPSLKSGMTGCVAAHLRILGGGGTGHKNGDDRAIPLTHSEHMASHNMGEFSYFGLDDGIDILDDLTHAMYKNRHDRDMLIKLMINARREIW